MQKNRYKICGHLLPLALQELIESGRWRVPEDTSGLSELLRRTNDYLVGEPGLDYTFYDLKMMESESAGLRDTLADDPMMWFGQADEENSPGDIDPQQTVLIADLGFGSDQPIALDYRTGIETARVLILWLRGDRVGSFWSPRWEWNNRWIEVAPDVATFIDRIRL